MCTEAVCAECVWRRACLRVYRGCLSRVRVEEGTFACVQRLSVQSVCGGGRVCVCTAAVCAECVWRRACLRVYRGCLCRVCVEEGAFVCVYSGCLCRVHVEEGTFACVQRLSAQSACGGGRVCVCTEAVCAECVWRRACLRVYSGCLRRVRVEEGVFACVQRLSAQSACGGGRVCVCTVGVCAECVWRRACLRVYRGCLCRVCVEEGAFVCVYSGCLRRVRVEEGVFACVQRVSAQSACGGGRVCVCTAGVCAECVWRRACLRVYIGCLRRVRAEEGVFACVQWVSAQSACGGGRVYVCIAAVCAECVWRRACLRVYSGCLRRVRVEVALVNPLFVSVVLLF